MATCVFKKQICCMVIACLTLVSFSASSQDRPKKASRQQDPESRERPKGDRSRLKDHDHPSDQNTGRQQNPVGSQDDGGGNWKTPTVVGAVGAATVLGLWIHGRKNPARELRDSGPQLDKEINMSGFNVKGFVKGGWPVVLDYQLSQGDEVLLTVTAHRAKSVYHLAASSTRRQEIVTLPLEFGDNPRPGLYSIEALRSPGQSNPAKLRLYGLGAGEKAVGSVAIDQLSFGPQKIHKKDEASFGFHSHSNFDRAVAEFIRSGLYNGQIVNNLDDKKEVKQLVAANIRIADKWNTKKAKSGDHLLQVRAWRLSGSDWVIAWSADLVEVEE